KLAGELGLLASGADVLILRTSWVYGARGQNFLLTMQRLFQEKDELNIVDDQIGAPTWSRMIAEVTAQFLAQTLKDGGFRFGQKGGLYHLTAAGRTSWYEFANAIRELQQASCRLHPIPTSDYPTPARRPLFSLLDNQRLLQTFGICLPHWHQSLMLCVEEMSN
ncbi:MAG: sugar nucleotide-binding protein, partial [Gammaproteobacteria bacterium]|nr:sugar nucleotide-binding protein [Gammaproteobacteria bacterium]